MFNSWPSGPPKRSPALFLSITIHTVLAVFLLQTHIRVHKPGLRIQVVHAAAALEPLWLPAAAPVASPSSPMESATNGRTIVPPDVRPFTPNESLLPATEAALRNLDPSLNFAADLDIAPEVLQTRLDTMPRLNIQPPVVAAPSPPAIEINTAAPVPPDNPRGGQLEPAQLLKKVVPVYPTLARTARVQGSVVVDAIIQLTGKLANVTVVDGHPLLVDAALDALKQWRYKPAVLNGKPIESPVHINVVFRMVFPNP